MHKYEVTVDDDAGFGFGTVTMPARLLATNIFTEDQRADFKNYFYSSLRIENFRWSRIEEKKENPWGCPWFTEVTLDGRSLLEMALNYADDVREQILKELKEAA